jgi:hypothetical protein
MDRQTLRDWVHRYNAEGIEGLVSRHGPGAPPALNPQQMAELKALVIKGPDPEKDNVVRWRCLDLREVVVRQFMVEVNERTIGKWLRLSTISLFDGAKCEQFDGRHSGRYLLHASSLPTVAPAPPGEGRCPSRSPGYFFQNDVGLVGSAHGTA